MEDKTLYVFDMDDTLIETPRLTDFVSVENGQIKTENENLKEVIEKIKGIFSSLFFKEICFKKSNDFIVVLDCRNKNPLGSEQLDFIQDLTPEQLQNAGLKNSTKKELLRTLGEENGVLVLNPFPGFFDAKETIGTLINPEILSIYKAVKNKMILTGRKEILRKDIEQRLKEVGIDAPNFGLHLFLPGRVSISEYKEKIIQDSIINNGWSEIHFFEDREDWLDKIAAKISEKFPDVKFHKHLVANIKSKLTL